MTVKDYIKLSLIAAGYVKNIKIDIERYGNDFGYSVYGETWDYKEEEYVKFGIAELLRKKGFRGDCIAYYNDDGKRYLSLNAELHPLPCPTQAVACDWLTEEKDIYITAVPDIGNSLRFYPAIYVIKGETPEEYWFEYINSVVEGLNKSYSSPQQAIDTALEYVLTNMI